MRLARRTTAFSLAEVLIGAAIGLILVGLCYEWMTSSSRILSRGQNKMVDTNQAELVFRWIDQDVHTSAISPVIEQNGARLIVQRFLDPEGPDPLAQGKVTWTFVQGPDGAGSSIERAVEGSAAPARFAVGTLVAWVLKSAGTPARPGLSLKLMMKQPEDNTTAVFAETFLFQNQIVDPRWNPLGPLK